jgi:hypothetical protein
LNGTPVIVSPDDATLQRWNGTAWIWPAEILRDRKLAAIAERYLEALQSGFTYSGKVVQLREQDQGNLTAMGNEARWAKAMAAPWSADFAWRMADDSFLNVPTAEAMINLAEAAKAEVYRLQHVKWAHVDAVRALGQTDDIAAYDFETGW